MSTPDGLAFDARGNLFAANSSGNNITEFAVGTTPGAFGTGRVVETGLSTPAYIAFGPLSSAAVPEASTTASLGFLLGLAGLVIAAMREKTSAKA